MGGGEYGERRAWGYDKGMVCGDRGSVGTEGYDVGRVGQGDMGTRGWGDMIWGQGGEDGGIWVHRNRGQWVLGRGIGRYNVTWGQGDVMTACYGDVTWGQGDKEDMGTWGCGKWGTWGCRDTGTERIWGHGHAGRVRHRDTEDLGTRKCRDRGTRRTWRHADAEM